MQCTQKGLLFVPLLDSKQTFLRCDVFHIVICDMATFVKVTTIKQDC